MQIIFRNVVMLRFIKFPSSPLFFFKRIRIGLRLFQNSLTALTFQHGYFFIFCFIIAFTQFIRIQISSSLSIYPSLSMLYTEALVGQNFFDVLVDFFQMPITIDKISLIMTNVFLYFIELLIVYHTSIALVYFYATFTSLDLISIRQSFKMSLTKFSLTCAWILVNMLVFLICSLTGFIGDIAQFFWQLTTVFSFQIIAFEKRKTWGILRQSVIYFKKRFSNILGFDLLTDFILVLLSASFYYFYKAQVTPTFNFLTSPDNLLVILMFYLITIVYASEIMTFTALYQRYYQRL
jgi:hypothetical protein